MRSNWRISKHLPRYRNCNPILKRQKKILKNILKKQRSGIIPLMKNTGNLLKMEIKKIQEIISSLNPSYAVALSKSLERYVIHVKRATYSIFRDFIFPLAMPDLKDNQSAGLNTWATIGHIVYCSPADHRRSFLDVAVRDVVMAMGAFTLAKLTIISNGRIQKPASQAERLEKNIR